MFVRLVDEITDPNTLHEEFMRRHDAVGENGASALRKLIVGMRQLAYARSFDDVEEYTLGYRRREEGTVRILRLLRCTTCGNIHGSVDGGGDCY